MNESKVSKGERKLYGALNEDGRIVDVSHSWRALLRRASRRISTAFAGRVVRVRETRRSSTHAFFEVVE
jgi:hypothetical protein